MFRIGNCYRLHARRCPPEFSVLRFEFCDALSVRCVLFAERSVLVLKRLVCFFRVHLLQSQQNL
jgi:hypothetical protein